MLILICGSRHWKSWLSIRKVLKRFDPAEDVIMHGAAMGADSMAGQCAWDAGFTVRSYPAQWDLHGKAAGPIRNRLMLAQHPDIVLAFHADINSSKGTKDMIRVAEAANIPTEVFTC